MDVAVLIAFAALCVGSYFFARCVSRDLWFEKAIFTFLCLVFQILLVGYSSSLLGEFGNGIVWLLLSLGTVAIGVELCIRWLNGDRTKTTEMSADPLVEVDHPKLYPLLVVLGGTVSLIACANLYVALFSAPHNFDSHTCHLARTAHFLQQGSLDWYPSNMWAQVTHPRNHPILLGFAFKVGGENATQLVNWIAWLMSGIVVFGVVMNLFRDKSIALISGLLSMLLVNGIMMSTTTQNDLLMAVHVGMSIYLLTAWYRTGRSSYLFATSIPLFVCFGIKASSLLFLPSFLAIAIFVAWHRRTEFNERFSTNVFSIIMMVGIALVAASPTGYIQNMGRYGHPLGPEHVRSSHTLEGLPLSDKAAETGKNVIRYVMDSTSFEGVKVGGELDGLRQSSIAAVGQLLRSSGCDLEDSKFSKHLFHFERRTRNHEDHSWWGVASILLIWPSLVFCLIRERERRFAQVFALAFLLFLIFQGYAQYDPWKGRYFAWASALIMVPAASMIKSLLKGRAGQTFLMIIAVSVCISSSRAVLYRTNSCLVEKGEQASLLKMDRADQISRNLPTMAEVIRKFEERVPPDATVAIALSGRHFFYPYYGPKLTRQIIHVPPNPKGVERCEQLVDFIVFSDEGATIAVQANDELLGATLDRGSIYLRVTGTK